MKNENKDYETTIDARDFLGNYLRKEDLTEPREVRLVSVRPDTVQGSSRRKLIALFEGMEKPLVLNATNIRSLTTLFGTSNAARWRGPVRLYVDESVQYAGKQVGGIRIDKVTTADSVQAAGTNGATQVAELVAEIMADDLA